MGRQYGKVRDITKFTGQYMKIRNRKAFKKPTHHGLQAQIVQYLEYNNIKVTAIPNGVYLFLSNSIMT